MGIKKYIVIEQYKFVAYGRELAKDYNLKISFQDNIKKIEEHPDIIIFSSVLQYLPNPYEVIEEANKLKPKYIIIDRTSFGNYNWKIQDNGLYYGKQVSYPFCFINRKRVLDILKDYKQEESWSNGFDADIPKHIGILMKRVL